MYNFCTSAVTAGILFFLAIYNTDFIRVVTLGGTVLGSGLIAAGGILAFLLLRRVVRRRILRIILTLTVNSFIVTDTITYLPGWSIEPGAGTVLFLLVLCTGLTLLNEAIFAE